ncbi:tetratricopeptide repeat protein [Neisseria iguanae]|uniref:Tetratricopeptide repeat protein n=1 Tax=Neisseria iguanae TaxID=90242 RepID=A0A2P7TWW6_9NEIS|nr:tetratricopeptide repeat protein [Neisseria iguanae]PSJ79228.1 hypothetical protein C7N83_13490 [Neisseria iguanae]
MFFVPSRICAVAAAVMMLFAVESYAANEIKIQPKAVKEVKELIQKKSRYTPEERELERQRRLGVIDRANTVFTLLGAEMALQKGDAGIALATYMVLLNRTKSPEVAERALEMAVSLNAFEQAEMIYQKWREIEPVPGAAQKRMAWVRDLLMGNTDQKLSGLDDVLLNATEEQTQRIFLLLAQAAVQQQGLAEKAGREVHKAAEKYPDMPEAAIADVIFSAQEGNERHAVAAMQRLANLDAEILPPTLLTMRLVAQRQPQMLNRFFEETDTVDLSPVWQELEISSLIASRQPDKAYARLQQLLAANPNADLYIQAALLSASRKEDISITDNYLEKAYNTGTREQQGRAAIIGAMRYADVKNYAEAKKRADKISAPEYAFDKAVLKASIAAEEGNMSAALTEARRAQKLPEQQGRFFGAAELQRVYLFALAQSDKPKAALAELNNMMAKAAKQPESAERLPDILYQRAMVYEKLGQHQKAVADLRRYNDLNPNSASGMNALGYTLLVMPNGEQYLDEAFKLIQAAYHLDPESAAINDSLGWAYYLKGDSQAALPYLEYAYREHPDAEVASHLGEVLWQLGQREQAKQIWHDGLQKKGDKATLGATMKRFGVAVPSTQSVRKGKIKAK